ncbi:MAG: hypothetical protein OXS29_07585 [bacterium]|nr:hypothetical protein [bacterium]MDE0440346.1 hypothetical protein [bacterium]
MTDYRDAHMTGRNTASRATDPATQDARGWAAWVIVFAIALTVLALWLTDLNLPLGDSDDGRILARLGLSARNFWDLGPAESGFGARIDPYIRAEYGVEPGMDPPLEAITYAHHPPLPTFVTILSVGLLGDSVAALRIAGFLLGSATIVFMAALARAVGMAWGPTVLATAAMAATGFFFVYGRIGVGFSLIAASVAMVAYLKEQENPKQWVTTLAAVLSFLTAMQSWVAIAAMGLLVVWLYSAHGLSPVTRRVAIGALAGVAVTATWLLLGTTAAELGNRVAFRVDSTDYPFWDFLARQWRFAAEFTPVWFRVVAPLALVAGLADRRTRIPVAITLGVAAAWTFGLRQGAWIHRLWNFPWVAPITIGLGALLDLVRCRIGDRKAAIAGGVGAILVSATFVGLVTGPVRDTYLRTPAKAGAILQQATAPEGIMWVTPGIPTPRWVSYHLGVPVWTLDEAYIDRVGPDDLVLTRTDRRRDYISLSEESILEDDRYRLLAGSGVRRR